MRMRCINLFLTLTLTMMHNGNGYKEKIDTKSQHNKQTIIDFITTNKMK